MWTLRVDYFVIPTRMLIDSTYHLCYASLCANPLYLESSCMCLVAFLSLVGGASTFVQHDRLERPSGRCALG